ncbi:hypothetical protein MYX78_00140 [Acidobacteria bacterium AH-259-G07]|nr:hypothetical protein [Acidobacteria bacterium AH-259-G07]
MPKKLERPYLHFTSEDIRAMRERLLVEANRLLDMPVSREVPARYVGPSPYYEGWRDAYELYFRALGRNCYNLAFIYQMTGDEKYAQKAYEFAEALSVLDSWVYTGEKFAALYWMGKPYGVKWNKEEDNEIVYSYDLSASRLGLPVRGGPLFGPHGELAVFELGPNALR